MRDGNGEGVGRVRGWDFGGCCFAGKGKGLGSGYLKKYYCK